MFIAQPLVPTIFAYGVVWLFLRKQLTKTENKILSHSIGVISVLVASGIFRLFAVATFGGRSAYDPMGDSGASGFYYLLLPGFFAFLYMKWVIANGSNVFAFRESSCDSAYKNETSATEVAVFRSKRNDRALENEFAKGPIAGSPSLEDVDDRYFAIVAKEMSIGKKDEGLWLRAYAVCNGDEKAATAEYIKLRVNALAKKFKFKNTQL